MAIRKSELYSSLWASCDELRGGMDASQYKDYVLVLLFIKYISDKYADRPLAPVTVPKGSTFADMVKLKGSANIGDDINKKIIDPIEKANGLNIEADFNDANKLGAGKEMVGKLTNLIAIFEDSRLDFSRNRADGDDILGDAYEYLMRHFATESGKSKGQFYTPAEVSRIMARIIGIGTDDTTRETTVYDPTCGSGSLLLKVADEARTGVTLYGQEKDSATAGLARMNMILHDNPTAMVVQGNTLADPKFTDADDLKTFDYVVANPPFSDKRWSTGIDPSPEEDRYQRFQPFGVPPNKQGDYAYLLHIVRSLKSTGRGACILPHGVLFRGNAEADIRRNLLRRGYIKGIIGLPANLFYGTGIPACIVVIDKRDAKARQGPDGGVFMIDASRGFMKDGPKNRLRSRDIHRIVDAFDKLADIDKYARMVPMVEIERHGFNLNIPRYIDSSEPEDLQDIEAHLRGGIPERDIDDLERYWAVCPSLRAALFTPNRPGYADLAVGAGEVRAVIHDHPEFREFLVEMAGHFDAWRTPAAAGLRKLAKDHHPKEVIHGLSEGLLGHYWGKPLVDAYAVYQLLMDYWAEAMQDDCYAIAAEGWVAKPEPVFETVKSGKKKGEQREAGWECDLVPKALIIARYFADKRAAIDELAAQLEAATSAISELQEEHGGEGDPLEGVSTKAEVSVSWIEAIDSAWAELHPAAHKELASARRAMESSASLLRQLEGENEMFVELRGKQGKVTKGNVKARLGAEPSDSEHTVLEQWNDLSEKIRESAKLVSDLAGCAEREVTARLEIDPSLEVVAEVKVLREWLRLSDAQSDLAKRKKEAEAALDEAARGKYAELSEKEVKALVVEDKWMASLERAVAGEVDRVTTALVARVAELAKRYERPLPELVEEVEGLEERVRGHLEAMGFAS